MIVAVTNSQHGLVQGAVLVTLKKGEDLPSADPSGYSDPYVKFKLNNKPQKSTIKRFTLNPAWNEKFEWFRVSCGFATYLSTQFLLNMQISICYGTCNCAL